MRVSSNSTGFMLYPRETLKNRKNIYIPRNTILKPRKTSKIWLSVIDTIGQAAADKIKERFGGMQLYCRTFLYDLARERHKDIVAGYTGGSVNDYAFTVGLSNVQVYDIFRNHGVALPDQPFKGIKKPLEPLIDYAGESPEAYAEKRGISIDSARKIMRAHGKLAEYWQNLQQARRDKRAALAALWQGEGPTGFSVKHKIALLEVKELFKWMRKHGLMPKSNRGNSHD